MSERPRLTFSPEVRSLANRCRLYQKAPGGPFYADLRPFAAWGGKQTALALPGERRATRDASVAALLYAERILALQQVAEVGTKPRESGPRPPRLGELIEDHLRRKAHDDRVTHRTVRLDERALRRWFAFLNNCDLSEITSRRIQDYIDERRLHPGRSPGTTLSTATLRNELHSLSNLMRRAVSLDYISENPVGKMFKKPPPPPPREEFLERHECSQLLDAAFELDQEARIACRIRELKERARELRLDGQHARARAVTRDAEGLLLVAGLAHPHRAIEPILEAVASLLLYTGMRHDEALGLLVTDIDLRKNMVHIRENECRKLKKKRHARSLTMWPGLRATMERYIAETRRTDGLLFPSIRSGGKRHNIAKAFARLVQRARLGNRSISPHTLRHTYTTFMLLTTVRTTEGIDATRSTWDVAQKLGHKSDTLVREVYAHIAERPDYRDTLDFEELRLYPSKADEWHLMRWQEPAIPTALRP